MKKEPKTRKMNTFADGSLTVQLSLATCSLFDGNLHIYEQGCELKHSFCQTLAYLEIGIDLQDKMVIFA